LRRARRHGPNDSVLLHVGQALHDDPVTRDVGGKAAVFVVGPGDKAQRRVVDATRTYGAFWVVKSGLRPGDKVITQGIANLKDGAPIKPVPANTPQHIGPPGDAATKPGQGAAARKGG
jgi:membrane fusion protein (multidrug efflux system)